MDRSILKKALDAYRKGTLAHRITVHLRRLAYRRLGLAVFNRWRCRRVWSRIEPRKVVFSNFNGNGYGCNPKYVCDELLRRNGGYDIVWIVKRSLADSSFPAGVRLVPWGSRQALWELATARVWVDNMRKNRFINVGLAKKPGQFYIQTFHGAIGIKTNGADMIQPGQEKSSYAVGARLDADMIDYLVSNSTYETNMYKSSFFGKGRTLLFGHPRNDVFFRDDAAAIRSRTLERLGLPDRVKYVLYAPTYREDHRVDCYGVDYPALLAALHDRFGGEWRALVRLHPSVRMVPELRPPAECAVDVCAYPDIQELLITVDAMVTDYSSCIFDFMLSGKPGFLFAVDLAEEIAERGFYYPLDTTPFPIGRDNEELCRNIRAFDAKAYATEVKAFLAEKGCMEDGRASVRVADLIDRLLSNAGCDAAPPASCP